MMIAAARPLNMLDEDERLFRDSVREFAAAELAPKVRAMDEAGAFDKGLLQEFFKLGLMGIEIPEAYGGQGGTFSQALLAIEELAAVDPSAAVIVDVQNTLVNNALMSWGNEEQKRRWLPGLANEYAGSYALSEAQAGSDAFALTTRAVAADGGYRLYGPQTLDHQRRRGGALPGVRHGRSRSRLQGDHLLPGRPGHAGLRGGPEGGQTRHSRLVHLRTGVERCLRPHAKTSWAKRARATGSPSRR